MKTRSMIIKDTAEFILKNYAEWKAEAEQICQSEQSDSPFYYHMMQSLVDAIGVGFNAEEQRTMKRDKVC